MSLPDFLLMLGCGAGAAFLLGLAVSLAHGAPPPERKGFEVHRHDR